MLRKQVSSSNINSVGYDGKTNVLEIEFNSGEIYQYFDVPVAEYNALINAKSHGKYFASNIKNKYRYKKM